MKQTGGGQNEGARADRNDSPGLRRDQSNPLHEGAVLARRLAAGPSHHDQSVQAANNFNVLPRHAKTTSE